ENRSRRASTVAIKTIDHIPEQKFDRRPVVVVGLPVAFPEGQKLLALGVNVPRTPPCQFRVSRTGCFRVVHGSLRNPVVCHLAIPLWNIDIFQAYPERVLSN